MSVCGRRAVGGRSLTLVGLFLLLVFCGYMAVFESYLVSVGGRFSELSEDTFETLAAVGLGRAAIDHHGAALSIGARDVVERWHVDPDSLHELRTGWSAASGVPHAVALFVVGTPEEALRLVMPYMEMRRRGANSTVLTFLCAAGPRTSEISAVLDIFGVIPDVSVELDLTDEQNVVAVNARARPMPATEFARAIAVMESIMARTSPSVVVVDGVRQIAFAASVAAFYRKIKVVASAMGLPDSLAREFDELNPIRGTFPRQCVLTIASYLLARNYDQLPKKLLITSRADIFNIGTTTLDGALFVRNVTASDLRVGGARPPPTEQTGLLVDGIRTLLPPIGSATGATQLLVRLLRGDVDGHKLTVLLRLSERPPDGIANHTVYYVRIFETLGKLFVGSRHAYLVVVGQLPRVAQAACMHFVGEHANTLLVSEPPGVRWWMNMLSHAHIGITDAESAREDFAAFSMTNFWLLSEPDLVGTGFVVGSFLRTIQAMLSKALGDIATKGDTGTPFAPTSNAYRSPTNAYADIVLAVALEAASRPNATEPTLLGRLRQKMLSTRAGGAIAAAAAAAAGGDASDANGSGDGSVFAGNGTPVAWEDYVPARGTYKLPAFQPSRFAEAPRSPDVSVVIPCFNGMPFMKMAMESLLYQTHANFEAIVVDDGSTDDSVRYVESLGDARFRVVTGEHAGLPTALNTGLRAAKAPLLTWGSADNVFLPRFIERLIDLFREFPEAGFGHGQYYSIDSTNAIKSGIGDNRVITPFEMLYYWPGLASFMWRRSAFAAVGFFDTDLTGVEDWDYWLRIVELFPAIPRTTAGLYLYRVHAAQMTQSMGKAGLIAQAETRMIQKIEVRHGGSLDPVKLMPQLKMCSDQTRAHTIGNFLLGYATMFARPSLRVHLMRKEVLRGFFDRALSFDSSYRPAGICLGKALGLSGEWEKLATHLSVFRTRFESQITVPERTMLNHLNNFLAARQITMFRVISCGTSQMMATEELMVREKELTDIYTRVFTKKPIVLPSPDRPYRLAVVVALPISKYLELSDGKLKEYFNPLGFFDEVFVLIMNGKDSDQSVVQGLQVLPVAEADYIAVIQQIKVHVVRAFGGGAACTFATRRPVPGVKVVCSVSGDETEDGPCCGIGLPTADFVWPLSLIAAEIVSVKSIVPPEKIWRMSTRVAPDRFKVDLYASEFANFRATFLERFPIKIRIVHIADPVMQESPLALLYALKELDGQFGLIALGQNQTNAEKVMATAKLIGVEERVFFCTR
eukprot:Opistho-2@60309